MMKLFTIATTCLAASGLASAQGTPDAAGPAAPRTGLYTGVTKGNAAADNTVDDFSRRPTLIGDKQYIAGYGGADLVNAAFSIKGMGWNWFGAVTAEDSMSVIRAGLGNGTAWGAGVIVGVDRLYNKPTGAAPTEVTTYVEPSGIALFGDMNLGSSDAYFQLGWNTGLPSVGGLQNSIFTKPAAGPEDDDQNHTLSALLGWKKDATTEGTHALNLEFSYSTEMTSLENPTVDATLSQFTLLPMWGYILRSNSSYSVFLGANGLLNYIQPEDGNIFTLAVSPNVAFQKQFGKGFEGFAGALVTASFDMATDAAGPDSESSQLLTAGADMAVGLRWVKDNFALEGGLKESVLANGPYLIGGNANQGLFYNLGLSLGF